MNEDPVAKRNRGGPAGLWILVGLAAVLVLLVGAVLLKPTRIMSEPEPAAPAVEITMEQRVAADSADRRQRDAARVRQAVGESRPTG